MAFCSGYTTNKAYLKDNSYPNLLFVNINTGQTSPDLYYDSRICTTGIVGSDFNFISNGNLVLSLNDTVYQALSPSILKRKYAMRFGEELEKTQKEYVERLKTEKIDAYQGDKLMKEIPCMYMFLETPSYPPDSSLPFIQRCRELSVWEWFAAMKVVNHTKCNCKKKNQFLCH